MNQPEPATDDPKRSAPEAEDRVTAEQVAAAKSAGRRWLRISLRTMFVLILLCSLGFSWYARRLRQQEESTIVPRSWNVESGENVKFRVKLGSQTYGTPTISGGKIFIGTNNSGGYLKRFPAKVDLGVLLCFEEASGKFLWQASSQKLKTGRVQDWPMQGVVSKPLVEADRLWFVNNRGEVVCLDTEGFRDDVNDGPYTREANENHDEADIVWTFDMIKRLGVSPHNLSACSVVSAGPRLFVTTGNGVDEGHQLLAKPAGPSFLCLDKRTGAALWWDGSPGLNILHGSWGSPLYGQFKGTPQVIFPGGDGWLYSFDTRGEKGKSKLLWKFDCNPKTSKWVLGGRGTRNNLLRTPIAYKGRIYMAVGQDPEHGEGEGILWCIDPNRRGDVSPELVFNKADPNQPIAHRRNQACVKEKGDFTTLNKNSAEIWRFTAKDFDGNGTIEFGETFHRSLNSVAIKNDLIVAADFSGLVHCFDAETGVRHWVHDNFSPIWAAPLIAGEHIYVANEDGGVNVYGLSSDPQVAMPQEAPQATIEMPASVYSTPVAANNVLFVVTRNELFAIEEDQTKKALGDKEEGGKKDGGDK